MERSKPLEMRTFVFNCSPFFTYLGITKKKKVKYWLGGELEPSVGINYTEKDIATSTIMYPEQHI